jgi:hypothetical protein
MEISEKAQKAIQEAVNAYPKAWNYHVCAFVILNRKTGENVGGTKTGTVCHADVTYRAADEAIVVNGHKAAWSTKNNIDYLRWCVLEAPFTHGILNRDNEKQLLGQASVIDTAIVGKGGALWLCKALRHFMEDTHKPKVWSKLRDQGLTGLQAFIGCDILTEEGGPSFGNTHVSLFSYSDPSKLREFYDELMKIEKNDTNNANRGGYAYGKKMENWGSLAGKVEKKPDGWGGFTEVKRPCDVKEYAAKLKEIFEGDPKNVG